MKTATEVFKTEKIYEEMLKIAEENGVELTETAIKIAGFRARTGMSMGICPCDKESKERGCIGPLCKKEIEEKGVCHCNAYRKRR